MLVLAGKANRSIVIGDQIELSELSIMGEDRDPASRPCATSPVFGKEVDLEIQQENAAAGTSARAEVNEALKRLTQQ